MLATQAVGDNLPPECPSGGMADDLADEEMAGDVAVADHLFDIDNGLLDSSSDEEMEPAEVVDFLKGLEEEDSHKGVCACVDFSNGYLIRGSGKEGFTMHKHITDDVYYGGMKLLTGDVYEQWLDALAKEGKTDYDAISLDKDSSKWPMPSLRPLQPMKYDHGSIVESRMLFDDTLERDFDHVLWYGYERKLYTMKFK